MEITPITIKHRLLNCSEFHSDTYNVVNYILMRDTKFFCEPVCAVRSHPLEQKHNKQIKFATFMNLCQKLTNVSGFVLSWIFVMLMLKPKAFMISLLPAYIRTQGVIYTDGKICSSMPNVNKHRTHEHLETHCCS